MKKIIFLASILFLTINSFGQVFITLNDIKNGDLITKKLILQKNHFIPKETVYMIDSVVVYSDTSGTFQPEQYIVIKDFWETQGYPSHYYYFNRNFDTTYEVFATFDYFDDLNASAEDYYNRPDYYFYIPDSNITYLYDQNQKKLYYYYNYINHPTYGYILTNYLIYNYDFTAHNYSGGIMYRVFFDENNFLKEAIYKTYNASSEYWENYYKFILTTDENGNIIETVRQAYNPVSSSWENDERYTYTYNSLGYKTSHVKQTWDYNNNEWVNDTKELLTYENDSILIEDLYQVWIGEPNNTWLNDYRYTYTYDENYNLITTQKDIFDFFEGWIPEYKISYTYDDNDNLTEEIKQNYDSDQDIWQNIYRYYYEYSNNLKTLKLFQTWDTIIDNWHNNWRYLFEYNSDDNLTSQTQQNWDDNTFSWINTTKYEYTYDGLKLVQKSSYDWITKGWSEYSRKEYYWTEVQTDVNSIANSEKYIYPNPASEFIYLPIEQGSVMFYSVDGKLVKSVEVNSSRLNISDLPTGIYTVKINNGKLQIIDKLVKY